MFCHNKQDQRNIIPKVALSVIFSISKKIYDIFHFLYFSLMTLHHVSSLKICYLFTLFIPIYLAIAALH